MSETHRRVYHPRLNAWQDVPKGDAEKWKAAGWRLTKPDHVDESDARPVGEHPGYASIPVLEDTSPVAAGTAAGAGSAAAASPAATSGASSA